MSGVRIRAHEVWRCEAPGCDYPSVDIGALFLRKRWRTNKLCQPCYDCAYYYVRKKKVQDEDREVAREVTLAKLNKLLQTLAAQPMQPEATNSPEQQPKSAYRTRSRGPPSIAADVQTGTTSLQASAAQPMQHEATNSPEQQPTLAYRTHSRGPTSIAADVQTRTTPLQALATQPMRPEATNSPEQPPKSANRTRRRGPVSIAADVQTGTTPLQAQKRRAEIQAGRPHQQKRTGTTSSEEDYQRLQQDLPQHDIVTLQRKQAAEKAAKELLTLGSDLLFALHSKTVPEAIARMNACGHISSTAECSQCGTSGSMYTTCQGQRPSGGDEHGREHYCLACYDNKAPHLAGPNLEWEHRLKECPLVTCLSSDHLHAIHEILTAVHRVNPQLSIDLSEAGLWRLLTGPGTKEPSCRDHSAELSELITDCVVTKKDVQDLIRCLDDQTLRLNLGVDKSNEEGHHVYSDTREQLCRKMQTRTQTNYVKFNNHTKPGTRCRLSDMAAHVWSKHSLDEEITVPAPNGPRSRSLYLLALRKMNAKGGVWQGLEGTAFHVDRTQAINVGFAYESQMGPKPIAAWVFINPQRCKEALAFWKKWWQQREPHATKTHYLNRVLRSPEEVETFMKAAEINVKGAFVRIDQFSGGIMDVPPGWPHQVSNFEVSLKLAWDLYVVENIQQYGALWSLFSSRFFTDLPRIEYGKMIPAIAMVPHKKAEPASNGNKAEEEVQYQPRVHARQMTKSGQAGDYMSVQLFIFDRALHFTQRRKASL